MVQVLDNIYRSACVSPRTRVIKSVGMRTVLWVGIWGGECVGRYVYGDVGVCVFTFTCETFDSI